MGANGTVNMTTLKGATGISDDRLSAHHPDGAGNRTKFGDFFIDGYTAGSGEFDGGDVPSNLQAGDQFSLYLLPPSGTSSIPSSTATDSVVGRVFFEDGDVWHWVALQNVKEVDRNWNATSSDGTLDAFEFVFEVTDAGGLNVHGYWNDGGYNSDATGYGEEVSWGGSATLPDPEITGWNASNQTSQDYQSGDCLVVNLNGSWNQDGSSADFDILIERWHQSDWDNGPTTTAEWSYSDTVTSESISVNDSCPAQKGGPREGDTFYYRLTVTNEDGHSDTATSSVAVQDIFT